MSLTSVCYSSVMLKGVIKLICSCTWEISCGRRDIMEFLLRYPSGEDLLLQRDQAGRIPLFYAERRGNEP